MSDRSIKGPDERWETVSKDTTRDSSTSDKNRQKPDDIRMKGEVTVQHTEDEDETEDEE